MRRKLTKPFHLVLITVFPLLQLAALPAHAGTEANSAQLKHGQVLSQTCVACHGSDGNTANPALYPNLASQLPAYIALQLANFKSGERPIPVMKAMVAPMSESDMRDLGAYFGSLPAKPQPSTDKTLEAKGREIFMHGSAAGAPACSSCHGAQGHGQDSFPRVASQPPKYTVDQLHVYRDAPKFSNPLANLMKTVAVKLSEAEIQAVSAYLATVK